MRKPRGSPAAKRRRATAAKKKEEVGSSGSKSEEELRKDSTKASTRGKRVKAPAAPTEFFPEKRNLEDLWQAAFPVGTEWDNMDKLSEINWNFSNLESAFEEGGELHGQNVYIFGSTEAQLLNVNGQDKVVLIPVVVAQIAKPRQSIIIAHLTDLLEGVVSPIPPSDKIGVKSVQRETEEIIPMKAMKMAWIPYIPLENRQSQVDRLKTQIFTLGCTQRRSALKHLRIERVKQYDYCLPYFQPLKADEDEDDTVVNIMFPSEPPVVCDFDWELDDLEEFTDELVKDEALPEDQKDAFKQFVKEQVKERKKEQRQAKEARKKAIEDMDPDTKAAFENMRFYKFYPVSTTDTPDISKFRVAYINRYYGKAHVVM